ncbi:hypothetical protein BDP55DRAFT_667231 [Colletotrichum godetiae]|uniref:Uncharacterized protein n=1 Tax=Colletotrichum godetiae TaxID=1209918 RepID=A0AAJ0AI39_9PEZI|nr:uncharacterized protein BDP55DRAFT_667231 [Colletotrichum godetiae]KAK1674307.1 hypothetical protein BDP55DRAFT_667231 [Colletotrichum godetiae]
MSVRWRRARGLSVNTNITAEQRLFLLRSAMDTRAGEARGCLRRLGVVELYLMGTAGARLRVAGC